MDIMSILITSVLGGGGGFLGNMVKKNGLGTLGNVIAGAVGGNALPAILSTLGVFASGTGDTSTNIMGAVTALLGGGVGSLIGGLFKKS